MFIICVCDSKLYRVSHKDFSLVGYSVKIYIKKPLKKVNKLNLNYTIKNFKIQLWKIPLNIKITKIFITKFAEVPNLLIPESFILVIKMMLKNSGCL